MSTHKSVDSLTPQNKWVLQFFFRNSTSPSLTSAFCVYFLSRLSSFLTPESVLLPVPVVKDQSSHYANLRSQSLRQRRIKQHPDSIPLDCGASVTALQQRHESLSECVGGKPGRGSRKKKKKTRSEERERDRKKRHSSSSSSSSTPTTHSYSHTHTHSRKRADSVCGWVKVASLLPVGVKLILPSDLPLCSRKWLHVTSQPRPTIICYSLNRDPVFTLSSTTHLHNDLSQIQISRCIHPCLFYKKKNQYV